MKRGDKDSVLSRGARYSQSIDALQNRSRIDQAEREAEEVKALYLSKASARVFPDIFIPKTNSQLSNLLVLSLINKINPTILN